MPNHITNRLVINADNQSVQQVLQYLKGEPEDGEKLFIDFNKIIPRPESLNVEASSLGEDGMQYLIAKQKCFYMSPEDCTFIEQFKQRPQEQQDSALALGRQYLRNIADHDYKDWYDWSLANWGTKWNAYDQSFESPNIIWFTTAWSGVPQLIQKLSEHFPDVEFGYTFADEDTGCNTGHGTIQNGESRMIYPDMQSMEAFQIAFEMNPDIADYYELTENGYRYKDDDEN